MNKENEWIEGFILSGDYKYIRELRQAFIEFIVADLNSMERYLLLFPYDPYIYVDSNVDESVIEDKALVKSIQETEMRDMYERKKLKKITLFNPKDVPKIRKDIEDKGFHTFEADIRFINRFLIDKDLSTLIKFKKRDIPKEYKGIINENFRFNKEILFNPEIKPLNRDIPLSSFNLLSLDIELDEQEKNILVVGLYFSFFGKEESYSLIVKKEEKDIEKKLDKIEELKEFNYAKPRIVFFDTEKELLLYLNKLIREKDPDIITGWNFIDFDLAFLREKARQYDINLEWGRDSSPIELRIFHNYLKRSSAKTYGRQIIDALTLLRDSYIQLEDYKLETAAQYFLNKGKLIKGDHRGKEIMNYYENNLPRLIAYNLIDCLLVIRILQNSNALNIVLEKSGITGLTLDRVGGSISAFDMLYLRNLKKRSLVARNVSFERKFEGIKGGYVKEPIPGVYKNMIILDFKSLYPSIMKTFNIDPLTLIDCDGKVIKAPNNVCFSLKEEGIIPEILTDLWNRRQIAKKNNQYARSYALKILMNSMFGAMANPACRYYNLDIANAITSFGRLIIHETARIVEEKGFRTIYSDTDSIFIDSRINNYEEAVKVGKELEKEINNYYDEWVRKTYYRKSFLEIEFEKVYKRLIFFRTRTGEGGAKKKYAGLIIKDGKEVLDMVGIEAIRRDWTPLARLFQQELLMRIFKDQPIKEFIDKFIEKLKRGDFDELLVYKKAIRKPLEEYTKTTPPHVKAARMLNDFRSGIIEYVMTIDGPQPIQKRISSIDYNHYIEKQLLPIAKSILEIVGESFSLNNTKNKSLKEFF